MKAYIFPVCILILAGFGLLGGHAATIAVVTLAFIAIMEHVEAVRARALLTKKRDDKISL